ncbi:MAG TPA: hypothetical protein ACQGQX_05415 [Xylella taiwanensis]
MKLLRASEKRRGSAVAGMGGRFGGMTLSGAAPLPGGAAGVPALSGSFSQEGISGVPPRGPPYAVEVPINVLPCHR